MAARRWSRAPAPAETRARAPQALVTQLMPLNSAAVTRASASGVAGRQPAAQLERAHDLGAVVVGDLLEDARVEVGEDLDQLVALAIVAQAADLAVDEPVRALASSPSPATRTVSRSRRRSARCAGAGAHDAPRTARASSRP